MATYKANIENTGLDTDEQVIKFVSILRDAGHDIEFTRLFGDVNPSFDSDFDRTWTDAEWEGALCAAA